MRCDDDPPATLQALCNLFAGRNDAQHAHDHPRGNCGAMAVRFAQHAANVGIDAAVVSWQATRLDPADHDTLDDAEPALMHWRTEVTVDGHPWLVDWTAGQFDPDAPHPDIRPAGCCGDCDEPEQSKYYWTALERHTVDEAFGEAVDEIAADQLPAPPAPSNGVSITRVTF